MKFQRKAILQILWRNSTLKAPVLLQNLDESINEMSEFRVARIRVWGEKLLSRSLELNESLN